MDFFDVTPFPSFDPVTPSTDPLALSPRRTLNSLGTDGNDTLSGTAFNDTVRGGLGNDIITGSDSADLLLGDPGNDSLSGNNGNDSVFGGAGSDFLLGNSDSDVVNGNQGNDFVFGNKGNDLVFGGQGDDAVFGGMGNDLVFGDRGNDVVIGDLGSDTLIGGDGSDRFLLRPGAGDSTEALSDIINDFVQGTDVIGFSNGLTLSDITLEIATGSPTNTVIRQNTTREILGVVLNVSASQLTGADFGEPTVTPTVGSSSPTPSPTPTPSLANVGTSRSLSNTDALATLTSRGNPSVSQGNTTFVAGFSQVSGVNQDPRLARYDNGTLTWFRSDYENTGADSRATGFLWDGAESLYAVFSIDGAQGTAAQDFRRFATNGWLSSYGQGGGPKVSVLARLDASTGNVTSATYLRAQLNSGRTNTLTVDNLAFDASGNVVVSADSFFSPLNIDRTPLTCSGSSPFDYTLTLTPDLSTAVSATAPLCS